MAMGPSTAVVDGQRFTFPTGNAYNPTGFGQLVQMQPISNVNVPPMVGGGGGSMGGAVQGTDVVGGYGTANLNSAATMAANQNPWSLRDSPLLWAVIGLVLSLLILTKIHWGKSLISGEEKANVGPMHESAEAGA
jgi:hypothetical protein